MLATLMDLKQLRESAGLSVEKVAVEIGKAVSTIRFWEAGTYIPSLNPDETRKILQLYKCSIDEFANAFLETQSRRGK